MWPCFMIAMRVGHDDSFFLVVRVVRDVDEGGAEPAMDALELELHSLAQLEVQRAEWFV